MLNTLAHLLVFQLLGEALTFAFALPIPGPVIGLALFFLFLSLRGGPAQEMRQAAQSLLQHLSLLFVPAGVGIVLYLDRLRDEWLALSAALVLSTVLALLATAGVMMLCRRRKA